MVPLVLTVFFYPIPSAASLQSTPEPLSPASVARQKFIERQKAMLERSASVPSLQQLEYASQMPSQSSSAFPSQHYAETSSLLDSQHSSTDHSPNALLTASTVNSEQSTPSILPVEDRNTHVPLTKLNEEHKQDKKHKSKRARKKEKQEQQRR